VGVGVILRNHVRAVVASLYTVKPAMLDPASAEAIAAWHATELSSRMEVRKIIIEGDAMEVVQAFRREGIWRGYMC
jgi:hypothetical protein